MPSTRSTSKHAHPNIRALTRHSSGLACYEAQRTSGATRLGKDEKDLEERLKQREKVEFASAEEESPHVSWD